MLLFPPSSVCQCQQISDAGAAQAVDISLPRRQILGAALLSSFVLPANACDMPSLATVKSSAKMTAPRDVCQECLAKRAFQRSAFVNKEAA